MATPTTLAFQTIAVEQILGADITRLTHIFRVGTTTDRIMSETHSTDLFTQIVTCSIKPCISHTTSLHRTVLMYILELGTGQHIR